MWEAPFWGALSASSLLIGAAVALRRELAPRIVGLVMGFGAGALVYFGADWAIDARGGAERKDLGGDGAAGHARSIVLGTVLDGVPESIVIGGSLVAGGSRTL